MSLLDKASIIITPTAYNVGSINAVKPNLDLSEELVVNGDFATDSDWLKGGGWSISNGKATSTVGNNIQTLRKTNNIGISGGKTYRVKFDVLDYVSGNFNVYLGNNADSASLVVEGINANGSYSYDFTSPFGKSGLIVFRNASADTSFSIDNVSVKEILPADLYFDRGGSGSVQSRLKGNQTIVFPNIETPRIDYTGGTGHWLIEPTSTNLITNSNDFDGSGWGLNGSPNPILTENQVTAPTGTLVGHQLVSSSSNNLQGLRTDKSCTINKDYTFSAFFKKKGTDTDFVSFRFSNNNGVFGGESVYFNISNGTLGTVNSPINAKIEDYGNGWYRCSATNTALATGSGRFQISLSRLDGIQRLTLGLGIYVFGTQLEEKSFPTSYIPTSGGTETRDTEVASGSGDSTMFNDSEGVLYLETASLVSLDSNFRTISICDGTNDETLRIRYSTIANRIDILTRSGASTKIDMNYTVADITDFHKIALKYKSGDSALWVDGVERSTSTSTFTHSGLRELKLAQGDANAPFYGKIKCIAVFKEALTDSELQCLTT